MSCSAIFISHDGVFRSGVLRAAPKSFFLLHTSIVFLVSQFQESVSSFNFLANSLLGTVPKFHSNLKQVQEYFPHEIIIRLQFAYVILKLVM